MNKRPINRGLQKAIKKAGSKAALGKLVKRSRAAISLWREVPTDLVLRVESATGVSRYELRPDVFGKAPEVHHAAT